MSPSPRTTTAGVLRCPTCANAWLVIGLREGDRHICKACGCEFPVTASLLTRDGGAPRRSRPAPMDPGLPNGRR